MATAVEVMRYIKSQIDPWGEMQLQKLVYYTQAWSLVWAGRPVFDEPIEAWQYGPVVRSLRHNAGLSPDSDAVDQPTKVIIDSVLSYYGAMNGSALSVLTHVEAPWLEARGELPPSAPSQTEVQRDVMRRFHTSQALQGIGPSCPTQTVEVDTDELIDVATKGAAEWESVLALLAR